MFSWAGNGLLVKDIRIEEKTIRLGRDLRRQGEKREYKVDSSHCWRKRQKCFFFLASTVARAGNKLNFLLMQYINVSLKGGAKERPFFG